MGPGTPRSRLPAIWIKADAPRSSQEVSIVAQTALVTAETVDDPWRNAQRQFDAAADLLGLEAGTRAFLREAQRQLIVNFPVKMDDGSVRMFEGYRVQHNLARGPAKGGIRYHPGVTLRRGQGAGDVDDLEVRRRSASPSAGPRAAWSSTPSS